MFVRRVLAVAGLILSLGAAALLPAQTKAPAAAPATRSVTAAPAVVNGQPLDLNTATPDQLKTLPGIGDAYARRIIDGRPYTMKNQLTQRGILPQATYDKVKDSVVARRGAAATATKK